MKVNNQLGVRLIDRHPAGIYLRGDDEVACNMQPCVKEIQFRLLHRSAFPTRGTEELENHRLCEFNKESWSTATYNLYVDEKHKCGATPCVYLYV